MLRRDRRPSRPRGTLAYAKPPMSPDALVTVCRMDCSDTSTG